MTRTHLYLLLTLAVVSSLLAGCNATHESSSPSEAVKPAKATIISQYTKAPAPKPDGPVTLHVGSTY
jgi:hypothetical protein